MPVEEKNSITQEVPAPPVVLLMNLAYCVLLEADAGQLSITAPDHKSVPKKLTLFV